MLYRFLHYSYNFINPSDLRQKENIRTINNALDIVLKLEGVKYDIKSGVLFNDSLLMDEETKLKIESQRKDKIGFIAQDVHKILPEVVSYDETTDIYGIDYSKVVPVLVNAIKEQQKLLDSFAIEITNLKSENASTLKSLEMSSNSTDKQSMTPILFQNIPNPFNQNTEIKFFIPEECSKSVLSIYNLQGSLLKSIIITQHGNGAEIIHGSELQPGIYIYNLIVDGREIAERRMILTK